MVPISLFSSGATIVAVLDRKGSRYGGYSPLAWKDSEGDYINTDNWNSFVFRLSGNRPKRANPALYREEDYKDLSCCSDDGPMFGGALEIKFSEYERSFTDGDYDSENDSDLEYSWCDVALDIGHYPFNDGKDITGKYTENEYEDLDDWEVFTVVNYF